jgi:putative component of toxin-antitoxin plasmid stabilization module
MTTFALEKVSEVKGKINFFLLKIDGVSQFLEFEEQIREEGNLASELTTIQVRMQEMAEMRNPMPKTKCRDLTPKGDSVKEYELKTKNLRVYLIHEEHKGRIIVLAGKKSTQPKELKKFRKIKEAYLKDKAL